MYVGYMYMYSCVELTDLEYTQLSLLVYIHMRQLSCDSICQLCATIQLSHMCSLLIQTLVLHACVHHVIAKFICTLL
jgi:hypothetical protein